MSTRLFRIMARPPKAWFALLVLMFCGCATSPAEAWLKRQGFTPLPGGRADTKPGYVFDDDWRLLSRAVCASPTLTPSKPEPYEFFNDLTVKQETELWLTRGLSRIVDLRLRERHLSLARYGQATTQTISFYELVERWNDIDAAHKAMLQRHGIVLEVLYVDGLEMLFVDDSGVSAELSASDAFAVLDSLSLVQGERSDLKKGRIVAEGRVAIAVRPMPVVYSGDPPAINGTPIHEARTLPLKILLSLQCIDPNDPGGGGSLEDDELYVEWFGEGLLSNVIRERAKVVTRRGNKDVDNLRAGESALVAVLERVVRAVPGKRGALTIWVQDGDDGTGPEDIFRLRLQLEADVTGFRARLEPLVSVDEGKEFKAEIVDTVTGGFEVDYQRTGKNNGSVKYSGRLIVEGVTAQL